MRFLAAEAPSSSVPDVYIQGVAYDGGVSWRRGAADGPRAIREASDSIESFSPTLKRDLEDARIADIGDVALLGHAGQGMVERVSGATAQLAASRALVVTLGGDHSISIGTSRGLHSVYPDLAHVVFDAHLDMRTEYEGDAYSHACGTRHMANTGPTVVLGIRSGSKQEFDDAERMLVGYGSTLKLDRKMRTALTDRAVFVSVDLDVLDPSVFPGTGNPEPGGATYIALRDALLALEGLEVVGLDLVECAPAIDPTGMSAIVAAELARDGILGFLRAPA